MEKIIWTDRVTNEEVLNREEEERNTPNTIKWRKGNWIGRILLRNCLLKQVTEGKIRGTGRRGRRSKQPLDAIKENRRHCNLE